MAIKAVFESRLREVNAEIRAYPTPIARCDEQLTALIEERTRLVAAINQIEECGGCSPIASWTNDGGCDAAQSA